jgi:transposase
VVILDNLSAHKGQKVKQLIESRAARVVFLPAYSPDFKPIEEAFSKIKAILKKKKKAARGREALIEAIGRALEAVRRQDAWGWFAHCGYVDGDQSS